MGRGMSAWIGRGMGNLYRAGPGRWDGKKLFRPLLLRGDGLVCSLDQAPTERKDHSRITVDRSELRPPLPFFSFLFCFSLSSFIAFLFHFCSSFFPAVSRLVIWVSGGCSPFSYKLHLSALAFLFSHERDQCRSFVDVFFFSFYTRCRSGIFSSLHHRNQCVSTERQRTIGRCRAPEGSTCDPYYQSEPSFSTYLRRGAVWPCVGLPADRSDTTYVDPVR